MNCGCVGSYHTATTRTEGVDWTESLLLQPHSHALVMVRQTEEVKLRELSCMDDQSIWHNVIR